MIKQVETYLGNYILTNAETVVYTFIIKIKKFLFGNKGEKTQILFNMHWNEIYLLSIFNPFPFSRFCIFHKYISLKKQGSAIGGIYKTLNQFIMKGCHLNTSSKWYNAFK